MPRTVTDARDRILKTATKLFYEQGIRAIGVDLIIAQSEVAKTTFYRYFPAKDDLVVAYLEERDRLFWTLFEAVVGKTPDDPKQQLVNLLCWLDEVLASPESSGCPFLAVASEFPEVDYRGHQVAIEFKTKLHDRITTIVQASGINQAEELSAGLMLLIDGAFVQRRLYQAHRVNLQQAAMRYIASYTVSNSSTN